MAQPDVTITLGCLARWHRAILGTGPNVRQAFVQWVRIYTAFIRRRFVIFSRGGGNWPELKPATIARRRGNSAVILRDTNLMFSQLAPELQQPIITNRLEIGVKFGGHASYPNGVSVADVMGFHHRGEGNLPVRKILVGADRPTQQKMRVTMKQAVIRDAK